MHAVLLDLDGVLWFSEAMHKEAFRQVLREHIDETEIVLSKTWEFGEATESYFQRLIELGFFKSKKISLPELVRCKREKTNFLSNNIELLNTELIETLKGLKRFPVKFALVTSSSVSNVQNFLKLSELESFFDVVIDNSQVKEPKPSPECYFLALDSLLVEPHDAVVVEDSKKGVKAAREAGIINIIEYPTKNIGEQLIKFITGMD